MTADAVPPKFLSLEFHARFFPGLLRDRYLRRVRSETPGTTFTSTTEMTVTLVVCLILAVIGIPSALTRGSIVGWILTALGVGGTVLLVILSVAGQWGTRPTYGDFLGGLFFFFVSLAVPAGVAVGMETHSPWLGILAGIAGLLAGYALGILAGLRMQHLGWIATIVNMLAGLAAIIVAAGGVVTLVVVMMY